MVGGNIGLFITSKDSLGLSGDKLMTAFWVNGCQWIIKRYCQLENNYQQMGI